MEFSEVYEYSDGLLVNKKTKHVYHNIDKEGYLRVRLNGREYRGHRVIWELFNGPIPEGYVIDHIDGDTLNNNISNLRLTTIQQNMANSRKLGTNALPKGVTKVGSRYRARISHLGVTHSIGTFDTAEEAGTAYSIKAIELNGEFAKV